jgi:hypothetical protein
MEEGSDDGEPWCKTTARPWGLATQKESPNDRAKRRLANGEGAVAAYLGMGKSYEKRGSFGWPVAFIGGGEREGCCHPARRR